MVHQHTGDIQMAKATARHILVATEEECLNLKKQIEGGVDFTEIAQQHSTCPSGRSGGDLGSFGPGQMVPEFDTVVFSGELNTVHGPVKTQFGYHLLEITSRTP
jgi:peptidyl-prolyl cis-trans isomerase C